MNGLTGGAPVLVLLLAAFAAVIPTNRPTDGVQVLNADPSLEVCPTSNCPAPPAIPVLATQFLHGRTTRDADHAEWLSTIGLHVGTGAKQPESRISGQKVAQYIGVLQSPGAGTAWTLNTDIVRNANPGGPNSFAGYEGSGTPAKPGGIGRDNGSIGYELDFTNWDADSYTGVGAFTVGQYFHTAGSYTSLAAIYLDAEMDPRAKAWDNGIFFNGSNVIRAATFVDATNAETSVAVSGTHRLGLNTTQANRDMEAVALREGQTACFNGLHNCVSWRDGKFLFFNKQDRPIFSVDENGNATFAGRITQNARP